jgi:hypothetical protein
VFFFNRKLTEGPIPIFLQSTGTNAKQKKVQGPMPKSDESAGINDTFKPLLNNVEYKEEHSHNYDD